MLKAIPNLDGYYASSDGRIWSSKTDRWMLPCTNRKGYLKVHIGKKLYSVHKLIALAFIPNPDNLETVDHVNEIKTDNRPENLRWMTRGENKSRSWSKQVICNETGEIFKSLEECSIKMGLQKSKICLVCKGKRNHTGGYTFSYLRKDDIKCV